jgi:hypothetical protein
MLETPEPVLRGEDNRALLVFALELRKALRLSNADKAALREWARGVEYEDER